MAITNKEIIEKLECLEARYSGTELQEIHKTVNEIKEFIKRIICMGTKVW